MIKIFDRTQAFPGKVNFIDENNNLIGFDMDSCCCEDFGWYIEGTDLKGDGNSKGGKFILQGYYFNRKSLQIIKNRDEEGGKVIIALNGRSIAPFGKRPPILTLHLFNNHNGYYSHGFNLKIDDETIVSSI